jgi:MFS superfamily sulfate permease-like transporter
MVEDKRKTCPVSTVLVRRSLLASLVSALMLLSVVLYLGPFFQPLPLCVLASIIMVSLIGLLKKVIVHTFKLFVSYSMTISI